VDGLVDLEKAARLRPGTLAGFDPAPDEDDLAGLGDREGRHDETRIDVGDMAACGAGQPMAVLTRDGAELEWRPAA